VLCIAAAPACSQKAAPSLSGADRQQLAQFIKPKLVGLGVRRGCGVEGVGDPRAVLAWLTC
jgi:hypothetical protein